MAAGYTGERRAGLHAHIAARERELFREHLTLLAATRHRTADRLGASPTGFLAGAADSVEARSDAAAADILIGVPGLGRAFADLHIRARNAGALTIPVHGDAYGRRAGEFDDLFIWRAKKEDGDSGSSKAFLARKGPGDTLVLMYVLLKSVIIPQDRSLLPSDEEITLTAEIGALDYQERLEAEAAAQRSSEN
jgi:hypothetical protein